LLERAWRSHRSRVEFVGIDVQDGKNDALDFLREFGVGYRSVRDHGSETFHDYGLSAVPETFYIDRRGRIVAHDIGPVTEGSLAGGIARALRSH
jgi:cytochrome c biogenesis protein CcmG/thiol:disulfide interchange protein DsbE